MKISHPDGTTVHGSTLSYALTLINGVPHPTTVKTYKGDRAKEVEIFYLLYYTYRLCCSSSEIKGRFRLLESPTVGSLPHMPLETEPEMHILKA
jgi:hypothetical protein